MTHDRLHAEVERRAATPGGRALAVFDVLGEWLTKPGFEDSPAIRALLERSEGVTTHAQGQEREEMSARDGGAVRHKLESYAELAGAYDPVEAGHQLYILLTGAIVSACRGDGEAAGRARLLAELLLASSR